MDKIKKIHEMFKEKRDADIILHHHRPDGVQAKTAYGVTVFVEGECLVFSQLGRKLSLKENEIQEMNDRHIKIDTFDTDGQVSISINLRLAP